MNVDGLLCERFNKFSDVSKDRSASAIARLVVTQLIGLGYLKNLFFDRMMVLRLCQESRELNSAQAKVKESAPDAIFIHCFAHKMSLVLTQAT